MGQCGNCRVDGFGDRGGEDDLPSRDRGEGRHLISGIFDQGANDERSAIGAAGIGLRDAEHLVESGDDLGAKRRD